MSSPALTPEHILQTGTAFWASKTLLSAVEMEVFYRTGETPGRSGYVDGAPRIASAIVAGFSRHTSGVGILGAAGWGLLEPRRSGPISG